MIEYCYDDGGRAAYFRGEAADCATRAVAIAADLDYLEVYGRVNRLAELERRPATGKRRRSTARGGVHMPTMRKLMDELGWTWHPVMGIGTGTTMHVTTDELPAGRLVLRLSRHYAAVIDRVLHDNHDSSRDGTRCVYGYWSLK